MNKPQPATPLADRLDKQGVMLTFVPRDAHLSIESAHDRQSPRSINMHVDLEPGQDIRLPNDHSLKTLVWGLHLVESTSFNENAAKEGALGFAIYSEEKKYVDDYFPESCYISAALHPDKFSALLDAIQSGHLPEQIVVTARGLSYGWEPDGAGKVWDIKKTPVAPVIEIRFTLPLTVRREGPSDPLDETAKTDRLPATAGDLRSLERKITASLLELRGENSKRWGILFVLLVLVVVLMYFRR